MASAATTTATTTTTTPLQIKSTILNLFLLVAAVTIDPCMGCPKKCMCLQGGIVVCQNKYLLEIPTDLPSDTQHAYIGANFIRKIRKNTFKNNKALKTLEVSSNYLRDIEPGAFEYLEDLRTLTLRDNNLPAIRKDMFTGLKNLQNLDLSDVAPKDVKLCIEDDAFRELENLVSLKLDHNRMIGISNRTLSGLDKLEHLDLSNNDLKVVSGTAFASLQSAAVLFDESINCCCSTMQAMRSITDTNGNCVKQCSDSWPQCAHLIKSTCQLVANPRTPPRTAEYHKRSPQTHRRRDEHNINVIPKRSVNPRTQMKNISFDVQIERRLSYMTNMKRTGVGLTRNEQWSIAITTCLVFVVSVLMFLVAIYCKKKKFSYHMKCCSRNDCVLNNSSNSIVNEINMMNKYFTTPSESHI